MYVQSVKTLLIMGIRFALPLLWLLLASFDAQPNPTLRLPAEFT